MKLRTYQSTNTTTWAIIIHDPQLRMDLESIEEGVDILRFAILELLQNTNLVQSLLDAVVFRDGIDLVVLGVHIDDFKGYYTVMFNVRTIDAC